MKLSTHYVEKPWGRTDLPAVFSEAGERRIGEVWFDAAGDPLPILVKWLFTSEKLSIQVHPNDAEARARGLVSGKEECWFIVDAEPGATLGMGTIRPLSGEELRDASLTGAIEELMDWKPVAAGDYFYIPAGTVHAIGIGITLVEVQQNADVTYRLYDYGRPRELHLDDGVAVSKPVPYSDPRAGHVDGNDAHLVDSPYFQLWLRHGADALNGIRSDVRRWLIPLAGSVETGGESAVAGQCILAPADAMVQISDDAKLLVAIESLA